MGSFWLSSKETHPELLTTEQRKTKDTGLERWVTAWKYSSNCVFLKYLLVHSLSQAAVGIPTQSTLRWLWAAHSSVKQLRLFPRALQVIFPGSLHLQNCSNYLGRISQVSSFILFFPLQNLKFNFPNSEELMLQSWVLMEQNCSLLTCLELARWSPWGREKLLSNASPWPFAPLAKQLQLSSFWKEIILQTPRYRKQALLSRPSLSQHSISETLSHRWLQETTAFKSFFILK